MSARPRMTQRGAIHTGRHDPLSCEPIRQVDRYCREHMLPLRDAGGDLMRCALGHPVTEQDGWLVVAADGRVLEEATYVPGVAERAAGTRKYVP